MDQRVYLSFLAYSFPSVLTSLFSHTFIFLFVLGVLVILVGPIVSLRLPLGFLHNLMTKIYFSKLKKQSQHSCYVPQYDANTCM